MDISSVDTQTVQSYTATNYVVLSKRPFTLTVNQQSQPLAELYSTNAVKGAAFITAYNPYSELLSDTENAARNEELFLDLQVLCVEIILGEGKDSTGQWPGESSFLALGINQDAVKLLGTKYQQNAIVWCDANAVPQLIFLK